MEQLNLMDGMTADAADATFSPCKRYRYTLTRTWDPSRPRLVFLMLNPSTADELANDPTVERCHRRAQRMGFGGVGVVNLFAFRSTNPDALYSEADPVGPENDAAILSMCRDAGQVICAWGTHGNYQGRATSVLHTLAEAGIRLHALAINADATPKHPLYVSNDTTPIPYPDAAPASSMDRTS